MRKCADCGKELPNDSNFCQYCGSKNVKETVDEESSEKKICLDCKKEIPIDSDFCQYCGSKKLKVVSNKNIVYRRCIDCGKELPKDSKFCQYCGSKRIVIVNDEKKEKRNKTGLRKSKIFSIIGIIIFVITIIIGVIAVYDNNHSSEVVYSHILTTDIKNTDYRYGITISAPKDKNVIVYIKSITKDDYKCFVVKKGEKYTSYLSSGKYKVYYAVGENINDNNYSFGILSECYKEKYIIDTYDLHYLKVWNVDFTALGENVKRISLIEYLLAQK